MTISIWRYSHSILALVSGLFLVLASVTGVILAFEPMKEATLPYKTEEVSEIPVSKTIEVLQATFDEVISIAVDANGFVLVDVVTKEAENIKIYVDPSTGEVLGAPQPQHPIFQFATNLHRSLFLKGLGRFFVGMVSFLLVLISITGFLLLIKRQGGIKKLFSRIQKDYVELQYHVVLARWFLVPIIIVAATGVYLSAERFSLLPTFKAIHGEVEPENEISTNIAPYHLSIFKEMRLGEVRRINFPFSEFPEDYFEIALDDREIYVHQYTGAVLSEQHYPFYALASRWSLVLHTGQGSVLWALVLLGASLAILFFVYSGFVMWRKRIKTTTKAPGAKDKDECTHIILVGSETGTTFGFAKALEKAFSENGIQAYVSELNGYSSYAKAEHLIVLTATYGEGEAPTNARNFEHLLTTVRPSKKRSFSVVGFGSLTYPSYCQFAVEVDALLQKSSDFVRLLPLYKVNNQSFDAFTDWSKKWATAAGTTLAIKKERKTKPLRKHDFQVVQNSPLNVDDTFLIRMLPKKKLKFQSGDLWGYTAEDGVSRWYSIAKINNEVVLSIKKHEFGLVSTFLSTKSKEDTLTGGIKRNHNFHFPRYAQALLCICNGTGIAPFLGMIQENHKKIPIDLYWGGRTKASFQLYKEAIALAMEGQKLDELHFAFSQEEENKRYVQDLLKENRAHIAKELEKGTVFMICGSLAMQNAVLDVLAEIAQSILAKPLSEFEHQEQLLMDCY